MVQARVLMNLEHFEQDGPFDLIAATFALVCLAVGAFLDNFFPYSVDLF